VLRALARELPAHGWDVTVVSGSRHDRDGHGDAHRFYDGLDVVAVDYTDALLCADPMSPPEGVAPMHPSFEDRPNAADRVFAGLDADAFERQVGAWSTALEQADAANADVLHLSHLTPINEAAHRVAPGVPIVGHLHGTELLMLERIAEGDVPASWSHADEWAQRMRGWARACERLVLLSDTQTERAVDMLGIDPDRCVIVANGYDPRHFAPADGTVDRMAIWRRRLVDDPRGWRPGEEAGSIAYTEADLAPFEFGPTLLYVGRFTEVKRLGLLIHAHAAACERFATRAPLVLVGGHPGEWEGEHPIETIERLGARDVFLAGWHEHDELPELLHASDALVLPSVREQFGQVLVEAMACGVAPVAVDRYGPARIVDDGRTGWLVAPDDEAALSDALVEVVANEPERRRRAGEALREARERYSWPALAGEMAGALDGAVASATSQGSTGALASAQH